jgi:hypothetical protein
MALMMGRIVSPESGFRIYPSAVLSATTAGAGWVKGISSDGSSLSVEQENRRTATMKYG